LSHAELLQVLCEQELSQVHVFGIVGEYAEQLVKSRPGMTADFIFQNILQFKQKIIFLALTKKIVSH
jgi:hypothetical protein